MRRHTAEHEEGRVCVRVHANSILKVQPRRAGGKSCMQEMSCISTGPPTRISLYTVMPNSGIMSGAVVDAS